MLLYTMLYIVLAYLMLFAALTNSVCLNNASFFFLFKYFLCQGYELSGEIALKNNHYYYYYYYYIANKDSRSFLHTSLIEPHLTYCVEVWGNAYKSNLHPFYVKQKRIIRLVCKTGYLEHTVELLNSLYVLHFYDFMKYKIAIFMYKVFH